VAGRWEFTRANGALLVLVEPRINRLPDELLVELFRDQDTRRMFSKESYVLVTQVYSCKSYLLCSSESRTSDWPQSLLPAHLLQAKAS
jgi:hypothetical protein